MQIVILWIIFIQKKIISDVGESWEHVPFSCRCWSWLTDFSFVSKTNPDLGELMFMESKHLSYTKNPANLLCWTKLLKNLPIQTKIHIVWNIVFTTEYFISLKMVHGQFHLKWKVSKFLFFQPSKENRQWNFSVIGDKKMVLHHLRMRDILIHYRNSSL